MTQIVTIQGRRLAYFDEIASSEFWDQHWQNNFSRKIYEKSLKGFLGDFEKPFIKHLPKEGKILEAGCGQAKTVVALKARGYDCEGIDYAEKTIQSVNKLFPNLPVTCGDLMHLDVPDNYYQGYISLGVIEHRQEGPEPFLKEAQRILDSNGIAYISVPFINLVRKLKAKLNLYNEIPEKHKFYQYAFSITEMVSFLEQYGFQVIDIHGYASWKGIKDEIPLIQWIHNIPKVGGAYRILTKKLPYCDRIFGHMVGFVCRKV